MKERTPFEALHFMFVMGLLVFVQFRGAWVGISTTDPSFVIVTLLGVQWLMMDAWRKG